MAGMNMSQALQNIGANLPNIFRQRQQDAIALQTQQAKQKKDEEDAAQQAELSRIILDLKKGELEQSNVARAMGAEGRKAVDEFTTSRGIKNLPISREYGQPLSDVEREEKYSLRKYAPYEPSAKSIVEGISDTTKREAAATQKEAELGLKQSMLESREKMAGERNELQQRLLDEKLKAASTQAELDRIAAEERARIAAAAKGNEMKPEEKTQHALDVIDKINVIKNHPGFKGTVGMKGITQGFGLMKQPVAGTNEAGFNAEYNALRSLLTLDNIGKLKGVLSDTDMKILSQAASSLDLSMPEKDFRRELNRVEGVMSRVSQKEPVQTDKPQQTQDQFTIGQKKYSKKYGRELTYKGGGEWE